MMTDKEELTALLMAGAGDCLGKGGALNCSKLAEFLVSNGVIVLPCKVGDTVYMIKSNEIISCTVISIDYNSWGIPTNLYLMYSEFNGCAFIPMQYTDGAVFLTREEVEKALKERDGA